MTYIHTTGDMTVPLDYQNSFVKGMKAVGVQVRQAFIDTGHCPNFTRPKEVAEIVGKISTGEPMEEGTGIEQTHGIDTGAVEDAIQNVGAKMTK